MNEQEKNLQALLEQKITHGDVTKKTRWYFIVRRIGIIAGIILAWCLAIYFGSFIFFLFNDRGMGMLTDFGWAGGWELFISLPWAVIGLTIVLICIIEVAGWRFTRLYRQPFIYTMLGVLAIIILSGTLLERTHLHRTLFNSAQHNQLPVAGFFYHQFDRPSPRNMYFGTVLHQKPTEWQVKTTYGTFFVNITEKTRFPLGRAIVIQDHIIIFGPLKNGRITARGIRKINPEMIPVFYKQN